MDFWHEVDNKNILKNCCFCILKWYFSAFDYDFKINIVIQLLNICGYCIFLQNSMYMKEKSVIHHEQQAILL